MLRQILLILLCCFLARPASAQNLSPLDYGLDSVNSDEGRYEVLLKTHEDAVRQGCGVTYAGIKKIELAIPRSVKPIPLPSYTDFAGVEIKVTNNTGNTCLFSRRKVLFPVTIDKSRIAKGRFTINEQLRKGTKLLVLVDEYPWVSQRRGYNNGATRKDILLLNKGKAENRVISSYSTPMTRLKCSYCDVTGQNTVIQNLIFTRTRESNYITRLVELRNLNNISIKGVTINTPDSTGLFGETAIYIENSANVTFEDVTINGTYSQKNKYGYGIGMNNVWNSQFRRLKADGEWGVFGNNNINLVTIEDSDINRFDIHCYGKDVFCKRTLFRNLYNQFSSLYGILSFEKCRFINFTPVLFESSYSSYTHFKLILRDCKIDVDTQRPYLIYAGKPSMLAKEPRQELSKAEWPDIYIKNLHVHLPANNPTWTLFQIKGSDNPLISGISSVYISNLDISGCERPDVFFSNKKVRIRSRVKKRILNSSISVLK